VGALLPWVVLSFMALLAPLAEWLAARSGYLPGPDEDHQPEGDLTWPQ
jgi:hypothetical protein